MRFTLIFLATMLATVAPLPVDQDVSRNSALELLILNLIEELRNLMINGSEDIPPLDPLNLERLFLDLDAIGLENSQIEMTDVTVRQHSTFVIEDNFSFTLTTPILLRYTMVLDGHIPELEIGAGNYDMDVSILGFRFYGNGMMNIAMKEPRIRTTIVIGPRITIGQGLMFQIINCNVQFHLTGFESKFTGLFGGDEFLNDFVSAFLRNLIPEMVEFFEAEITQLLSTLVLEVGNEILADIDLGDILGRTGLEQFFDLPALEAAAKAAERELIAM